MDLGLIFSHSGIQLEQNSPTRINVSELYIEFISVTIVILNFLEKLLNKI